MHKLPWEVAEAIRSHRVVQAQLVGTKGLAWVLTEKKLFMWYYHNGQRAAVLSHALPYALSEEPCHVCAVQHQVGAPFMPTTLLLLSTHLLDKPGSGVDQLMLLRQRQC